jgi:hypothetical protein
VCHIDNPRDESLSIELSICRPVVVMIPMPVVEIDRVTGGPRLKSIHGAILILVGFLE